MVSITTSDEQKFKVVRRMLLPKSARDLLGTSGRHIGVWGQVAAFLEKEPRDPSLDLDIVLFQLNEQYAANGVRKE